MKIEMLHIHGRRALKISTTESIQNHRQFIYIPSVHIDIQRTHCVLVIASRIRIGTYSLRKKKELQTHFMMHTIKSWVFEPSEWWSSCIRRFRLIFTHLFISACCCVDSINVIDLTLWNVNQYKFITKSLCKQSVVDVYPCEYRQ